MNYYLPVAGDAAENSLVWDAMKLEAELYLHTGSYQLLRDVRMRQARFAEAEGNGRISIAYYCMVFYADLNGSENSDRLRAALNNGFSDWTCTAHIDMQVVDSIFTLCAKCSVTDQELLDVFCSSAFKPHAYLCHLFSTDECKALLLLARNGQITKTDYLIRRVAERFPAANQPVNVFYR